MKPEDFLKGQNYTITRGVTTPSISQQPSGRFSDIGSDIKETFSNISGSISESWSKQNQALGASIEGEQSGVRGLFQAFGAGALGVTNAVGDAVIGAGKTLLSQEEEEKVREGVTKVVEPVIESQPVQALMSKYESLPDKQKRDIDAVLGITELFGGALFKPAVTAVRKSVNATIRSTVGAFGSGAHKTIEILNPKKAITTVGKALDSDTVSSVVGKATGVSPQTAKSLFREPDVIKAMQDSGIDRFTIADDLVEKFNKFDEVLSDTGSGYNKIRSSNQRVSVQPNYLTNQLRKQGFDIVQGNTKKFPNGRIVPSTKSPTRTPADIKALQEVLDNWGGKSELSAQEFLNLRSDLAELSKFDRVSGKTKASESIAKDIRENLNKKYRPQIEGLKTLDEIYKNQKNQVDSLRSILFDRNGELKKSAVSRIARAKTQTDRDLINKLKKLDPQIEGKIKMIQVLEDVEYAKDRTVGAYVSSGLNVGSAIAVGTATGFLPAVLTFIATSPIMMQNYVKWAGRVYKPISKHVDSIVRKIDKGVKLSKQEASLLSNVIKKMTPESMSSFIDYAVAQGIISGATPSNNK